MKLLSVRICEHDANFTLYYDGVVSYYKTERLHQIKHHSLTLNTWEDELKKVWNISSKDLKEIVVIFDPWHHGYEKTKENFFPVIENYKNFPANCNVTRINHHYAHALSYWPISNKEPDICFVLDGFGDYDKAWSIFKRDKLIEEGSHEFHGSIGTEMAQAGTICGIKSTHGIDIAGKLMGLQSYGTIDKEYKKLLSKFTIYDIIKIFSLVNWNNYKTSDLVGNLTQLDWISTVHDYVGDLLLNFFKKHSNKNDHIFYAGGVAQNVIWNTKLKNYFPNLVIPPHCADEGLSLGGIEYLRRKYKLDKFSLPNFPYSQIDQMTLDNPSEQTIKEIAIKLSEGKSVGWYQGNGEIGPRALGNRSILLNPCIKNGKELINLIKKRETYRPFGASVLKEFASDYFDDLPDNPYMLYVGKVKSKKLNSITHIDGTCRVQTVDEKQNKFFYQLLKEFYNITGVPILLNTSLNVNGKPIAGSPFDAKELFDNSKLDILVVGDQYAEKV